jgi:hypothetical protein
MRTPITVLLREAVAELADEARQTDLHGAAVRKGRRLRRRRRLVTIGSAVVGVIAVLGLVTTLVGAPARQRGGPTAVAPSQSAGPPAGPPSPRIPTGPSVAATPTDERYPPLPATVSGPLRLPGGWVIASGDRWMLNRKTQRYQRIETFDLKPAPAGTLVAANDRQANLSIRDLASGTSRRVDVRHRILEPQWSADGARLLLSTSDKESGELGFAVVDGRTGAARRFTVDRSAHPCVYCQFTWLPGGAEVALPLVDRSAPRDPVGEEPVTALAVFSAATGRPTRTLPVRGYPAGAYAWSPDGSRVVLHDRYRRPAQLVEVATGKVLAELPPDGGYWISSERLLAVRSLPSHGDERWDVLLLDTTGRTIQSFTVPRQMWPAHNQGLPIVLAPA